MANLGLRLEIQRERSRHPFLRERQFLRCDPLRVHPLDLRDELFDGTVGLRAHETAARHERTGI